MKIFTHHIAHSKIEIVEISNGLTGRGALQLEEFFCACLDEGKSHILINVENMKRIDGLGIYVLEYFLKRGMQIRLFNVDTEIQTMLDLSGKSNIIKPYNETDTDKALSLFEKEILKKKDKVSRGVMGRRYSRVNTSFSKEFKYHSGLNGEIEGKANVLNLSEGGIFANKIIAFNLKTGEIVNEPELAGRELDVIKFSLNGSSKVIEAKGKCVWQAKKNSRVCVGIKFKGLGKVYKDRIIEHINEVLQFKD
jgi:anti-anti-sigma regulatory factor